MSTAPMIGMNAAEVEDLGRFLQSQATNIETIHSRIDQLVRGVVWIGSDATRFSQQWWPEHAARLIAAARQLEGLGQSALNNASEQRTASGEGGALGPAIVGTGAAGAVGAVGQGAPDSGGAPTTPGQLGVREVWPTRTSADARSGYDAWATGRFGPGGESHYQCTGWAHYRLQELGYDIGAVSGHGGALAGNIGDLSSDPSLHAVASYGAGTNASPGHVMIVEEMSADGSRIRVSEMNSDGYSHAGDPKFRDTKWFDRAADGTFRNHRGELIQFTPFPG